MVTKELCVIRPENFGKMSNVIEKSSKYGQLRYKCVTDDYNMYKANLLLSCSPLIMMSLVIFLAMSL